MRSGASASSARVPGFSPSTTSRWVGAPRRGFLAAFAALPLRAGAGAPLRAVSGTRAPNMSERITEIADSTKIHRIARNAMRIRKRVSSDIPAPGLVTSAVDADRHLGVADADRRPVAQPGASHLRPVDEDPVGRAEVDRLHTVDADLELEVAPADAGVVDPQVGLGAAADHQAGRAQRVAGAVDLERGVGGAGAGALVVVGDAGLGLGPDPEAAGGQVVGGLEGDADGSREDVALGVGVVLQLVDEVLLERAAEADDALEVGGGQLDVEVVGHQSALPAQHLRVVVALALEGGGDLDGLHRAAEGPGEDTGDHGLEPLLEALQGVHRQASSRRTVVVGRHQRPPDRCGRAYRPGAAPPRWRPGVRPIGRARQGWGSLSPLLARVAERQTRCVQVAVSERAWGFKSPLAHTAIRAPDQRSGALCVPRTAVGNYSALGEAPLPVDA